MGWGFGTGWADARSRNCYVFHMAEFDACIDVGPYNMPAGYDPEAAIQTMRHAVEAIPGARWISVEHHEYPLRNALVHE